jgi:ATP/maltotriose-dependent transcriptional regulator MalT
MKETIVTAAVDRSNYPSAFDAEIPTISYRNRRHADGPHHTIRQSRERAPIVPGRHGHDLLTYELVRALLLDLPPGMPHATYRRAVQLAEKIADRRRRIYALACLALIAAEHDELSATEHQIRRAAGMGTDPAGGKHFVSAMTVIPRNEGHAVREELTSKELGILRLLATQLSRREIGQRLYVSLNTVKTHQRAVYRKLGVENRSAAVSRARNLGLL